MRPSVIESYMAAEASMQGGFPYQGHLFLHGFLPEHQASPVVPRASSVWFGLPFPARGGSRLGESMSSVDSRSSGDGSLATGCWSFSILPCALRIGTAFESSWEAERKLASLDAKKAT